MLYEFEGWPKIPRFKEEDAIVTEKLDGTNAQINITAIPYGVDWTEPDSDTPCVGYYADDATETHYVVQAGSRNRWLSLDSDNFGFARWVSTHIPELCRGLGEGRHFGEWYGQGIQRGYGLEEKRFALFNTSRWNNDNPPPECCEVVPVIGNFLDFGLNVWECADTLLSQLRHHGSYAVPGYMNPEGIILWYPHTRRFAKYTFGGNTHKG